MFLVIVAFFVLAVQLVVMSLSRRIFALAQRWCDRHATADAGSQSGEASAINTWAADAV